MTTIVLALGIATVITITIDIHIVTPKSHLGLDLHGRPVRLNKAPPTGHVNCVPSVSPTVVHKLLRRFVLLRLGDQKSILTDTLPLTRLPCRSPWWRWRGGQRRRTSSCTARLLSQFQTQRPCTELSELFWGWCYCWNLRRSVGAPRVLPSSG